MDTFISLYRMKDLLGDDIRNASVDTDSFHNVVYNIDLQEMIANSLIERRCMIAVYGKHSLKVLDKCFLCEEFDLSSFPDNHICKDTGQGKWLEKLKFEHADQEILGFVSPMPKVYVDILEKWEDSKIAKGIPKKVKELQLNTEMYEECILSSFQGKEWKPKPVKFNMFRIVPHTHQT